MSRDPKIIVLGLDGLEYNFVKEWRLKNIMQKKYCTLDLSDYEVIVTPPIWGSMLTGKIDHEIMKMWVKRAEILGTENKVKQKWWAKLGSKILPSSIGTWICKKFIIPMFGLKKNPFVLAGNYIIEKNETNIFDFFEKPWTNRIPGLNYKEFQMEKRLYEESCEGDPIKFLLYMIKKYKDDKNQLISALEKQEYDIVFWYTELLDAICHIIRIRPIKLMNYYLEINNLIGLVKNRCPNSIIYIISDHGMERILQPYRYWWHSDHAFFSSSSGETIEKPMQLYDLILKHKTIEKIPYQSNKHN